MAPDVYFLSGKGGVGKTTLASALAARHARGGGRALVVSTDPAHNLGHLWHRRLGPEITELERGVFGLELSAPRLVSRHLERAGTAMRSYLDESYASRIDDYLDIVSHAPGTAESALLEAIADLVATRDELLIFDTAPTGHTRALMELPATLDRYMELLLGSAAKADRFSRAAEGLGAQRRERRGLTEALSQRRKRLSALTEALRNGRAAFILALTAERMPVLETIDFARDLTQLGIPVSHLIANRVPRGAAGERAAGLLDELQTATGMTPTVIPVLEGEAASPQALHALGDLLDSAGLPPLG
ncbi:MAG: ArsA family ATPase [Flaviflexus sp.]|nr:ArsA family ATPase [Flaviflexus sp.]